MEKTPYYKFHYNKWILVGYIVEQIKTKQIMANLSKEEIDSEIEKCKNSVSYFYNNYCRKEGMPEYSEEAFQEYIKEAENARQRNGYNRRGKVMLTREFPLTPNECMIKNNKN